MKSREIHLKSYPKGLPAKELFELCTVELNEELPEHAVLIKNDFLSVDPYMRGRMSQRKSYIEPFALNKPMGGSAIGKVLRSRSKDFPVGTMVEHFNGWREACIVQDVRTIRALPVIEGVSPSLWLGALGMPGLTAYAGLLEIGRLKAAETIFVSGAAGAVGSLAGQIAKLKGAKVIGSCGSPEKAAWLKTLGFDAVLNYRSGPIFEQLQKAAPDGLHLYFDNVGGDHLEAAISCMRDHGRIVMCGAIAQYNEEAAPASPRNLALAIGRRLTLRGFIVSDHQALQPRFVEEAATWLKAGKFHAKETIFDGLERMPEAFLGLFSGENTGKMVVRV